MNERHPVVKDEEEQIVGIFLECQGETQNVRLSADHEEFHWIGPDDHEKYDLIENLHPSFESYRRNRVEKNI